MWMLVVSLCNTGDWRKAGGLMEKWQCVTNRYRLCFVCSEQKGCYIPVSASHTSHITDCPRWQSGPGKRRCCRDKALLVSTECHRSTSRSARCLPSRHWGRRKKKKTFRNKPGCVTATQQASSSSSSPVGEEGDDGEGGVMGVCEDVLKEEVWVAAVL